MYTDLPYDDQPLLIAELEAAANGERSDEPERDADEEPPG